jgi:hypothetical protein
VGPGRPKKGEEKQSSGLLKSSNRRDYTEARLRCGHPKLYEAVQRGEPSANAAAIEAGFRKKLTKLSRS